MMFGTAVCIITIIATAFMIEIHEHTLQMTVDAVLIIVGAFGLVTIGTFQLDPYNKTMIRFHYSGVYLSLGIFFAFNYQQIYMIYSYPDRYTYQRLWYPILLDIISAIGFGVWTYAGRLGKEYQKTVNSTKKYDADYISKLSLANLAFEGIYFIGAGISLSSWMIFYPYASCEEWIQNLQTGN